MLQVAGLSGEAERKEIDTQLNSEIEVGVVLLSERREADGDAGEIDMTTGFHFPFGHHGADDAIDRDFGGFDLNHAAIDHDGVASFEIFAEVRVVDADGVVGGGREFRLAAKFHRVSDLELPGLLDIPGADAGAGEVHEDGDLTQAGSGLTDARINRAHPVVRSVAHVQAKDIGAFFDERGDDFGIFRGRAESAENFCFAHGRHMGADSGPDVASAGCGRND